MKNYCYILDLFCQSLIGYNDQILSCSALNLFAVAMAMPAKFAPSGRRTGLIRIKLLPFRTIRTNRASLLFFLFFAFSLNGQSQTVLVEGTVSFVSSQNVYVKFASTKGMEIGDTLFLKKGEELIPALEVHSTSSTSTVCNNLLTEKRLKGDVIVARAIVVPEKSREKKKKEKEKKESVADEIAADDTISADTIQDGKGGYKEKIKGRLSAASYSTFSDYRDTHRFRYAFSFRGDHLSNSKFSVDSYINFRHTLHEWGEVKEDLARALKVYSLAVKYDVNPTTSITFGRKINNKISSMGAIDGLQLEKSFGQIQLGLLAGSRPDYTDYNLNMHLFETGAYVSFVSNDPKKHQQSTIGIIEQRNHGEVDRRFTYFQYSGRLLKDLTMFTSLEADLFENINGEVHNKPRLTNFYTSLRYNLSKKIRLSASYDNRNNIIYYESYKSFIENLIEAETRQGLRFGATYRPFKYISWGVNSSLRFQQNKGNTSKNVSTYISISKIPFLKARANIRANFLETNYLKSTTYALTLSKTIIKKRLDGDFYYRWVNYQYVNQDYTVLQNVFGVNLSLRLMKKLSFYVYYEGTFDKEHRQNESSRYNAKLIQRF